MTTKAIKPAGRERTDPRRRTPSTLVVLTGRDKQIISSVYRHRFLTREQLQRIVGWGCVTKINNRLRKLFDAGYLNRRFLPQLAGSPPAIYSLGPAGIGHVLQGEVRTIERIKRNCRQDRRLGDTLMQHALGISDFASFLIGASRKHADVRWLGWLNDRNVLTAFANLCREPQPDGFGSYRIGDVRFNFFLEFDVGTESLKRIGQKLEAYRRLSEAGIFRQIFNGLQTFRLLLVTLSRARAGNLAVYLEAPPTVAVWIGSVSELSGDPFFSRLWRRPGNPDCVALHPRKLIPSPLKSNEILPPLPAN